MLLPNEKGYDWYWEEKDATGHILETGASPRISKSAFILKYEALNLMSGEATWSMLLEPRIKWLENEVDGFAHIVHADNRLSLNLTAKWKGQEDAISRILEQSKISIETAGTAAAFHGPQRLTEGWIKLKSTTTETE
jgi:hypothetical protein